MKVLLQDMPPLLHDLIACAIRRQPDMAMIGPETMGLPVADRNAPDVTVVGTDDPEHSERPLELLLRWPRSRVVMVPISGSNAVMYRLRAEKTMLGEMSPTRLIEVIRFASTDATE